MLNIGNGAVNFSLVCLNRYKMAACVSRKIIKPVLPRNSYGVRLFHETSPLCAIQAGKYKPTKNRTKPLTYEQANQPTQIAHRKSWNSWNTSTLEGGLRSAQTAIEDIFIRKFLTGTFHGVISSEIIIKRQHNLVRIAAIMQQRLGATKYAFLIGYTEELLGHWLQCPAKLELQFIGKPEDVCFKYI